MTQNFSLVLTFLLFLTIEVTAQNGIENVVGKNYQLYSTTLAENRDLQIYVPESYASTDTNYPVLYVLDGQRLFLHGVSLLQSFTKFKQTPEFIVVGITNSYPQRFRHFSSGAKNFQQFIANEVVPFMDENFRTSDERLLFGWEYAGSYVIQSMIDQPKLFDGYIAASPFPLNSADRPANQNKISRVDSLLSSQPDLDPFLYFSVSEGEGMVEDGTDQLNSLLIGKKSSALNWTYRKMQGEEHRSTSYATLYHGIRSFYRFYPEMQFKTLKEFDDAGGIEYVNEYYSIRANQYGFSPELTTWTKFTIIRNALRANNYERFDELATYFMSEEFIGSLKRNRPYELAEFYEKNNAYDKAIAIYKILEIKRPDAEHPLKALGDAYTALDQQKTAASYYKKADKVARQNSN